MLAPREKSRVCEGVWPRSAKGLSALTSSRAVLRKYGAIDDLPSSDELKEVMQVLDKNFAGKLSLADFKQGLFTLQSPLTERDIEQIFMIADLGRNGMIEIEEFLSAANGTSPFSMVSSHARPAWTPDVSASTPSPPWAEVMDIDTASHATILSSSPKDHAGNHDMPSPSVPRALASSRNETASASVSWYTSFRALLREAGFISAVPTAEEFLHCMEIADTDHNGVLSLRELKRFMKTEMRGPMSDKQIESLFAAIDTNGDNVISPKEFLALAQNRSTIDKSEVPPVIRPSLRMMGFMSPIPEAEELRRVVESLDTDGNCVLCENETKKALRMTGSPLTDFEIELLFRSADTDQDGMLNAEEFVTFSKIEDAFLKKSTMSISTSFHLEVKAGLRKRWLLHPIPERWELTAAFESKDIFEYGADFQDFCGVMRACGCPLSCEQLESFFRAADVHRTKHVSVDRIIDASSLVSRFSGDIGN
eukprot:TRINITY_DN95353_c0_g1_i1.p1 TRINITY_DN95353_c0_g1~~TRINITY_DN95353_c0_g1_i1.p1  ORF type:complete len:479 (+),score=66.83 TRINITY_DN95353_c0_g1_i1:53-1489(+)